MICFLLVFPNKIIEHIARATHNASSRRHSCFDVGVLSYWRTNQYTCFDYELKHQRIWGLRKDNNEDWLRVYRITSPLRNKHTQLRPSKAIPQHLTPATSTRSSPSVSCLETHSDLLLMRVKVGDFT